MEFPRQEYWSGWPFLHPEDISDPGIKSTSPTLQADSLLLSHQRFPLYIIHIHIYIYTFTPNLVAEEMPVFLTLVVSVCPIAHFFLVCRSRHHTLCGRVKKSSFSSLHMFAVRSVTPNMRSSPSFPDHRTGHGT